MKKQIFNRWSKKKNQLLKTKTMKPMFFRFALSIVVCAIGIGAFFLTENVAHASPPTQGTVIPTLGKPIAHVTLTNGEKEVIAYLDFEGNPAYCLNPAVPIPDGGAVGQLSKKNELWNKMSKDQQRMVNDIVYLANSQGAKENWTLYGGARVAIWEIIASATGKGIKSIDDAPNATSVKAIRDYADDLIAQAKKLHVLPSFSGNTVTIVAGVPLILTDTNNVLGKFPNLVQKISGLSSLVNGNKLTLNSNSNYYSKGGKITYSSKYNMNEDVAFVYSTGGDESGLLSQPVYAGNDPSINTFSLNVNIVLDGSLKIVKKQSQQDSHQGSGNIAGAKFDVTMFLSDGKTVDTGINGTFDTVDSSGKKTGSVTFTKGVAHNVTTGSDGTVTIKKFSPINAVATVKETYVPAPYTLGHTNASGMLVNDPLKTTITEDSTKGTAQLTFTDNKQVGGVKFKKAGLYNGADLLNNGYLFKGTVMGVKDAKGNVIAQATLDEKGEGSTTDNPLSSPLVIGETYTAFEISAGGGFVNTFAPKTVKFTYQGSNQVIDWQTVSGTNTEITGDVLFKKTVKNDHEGKSSKIEGANLSIYYAEEVKNASGKVLHKKGDLVSLKDGLKNYPIKVTHGTLESTEVSKVDEGLMLRIDKNNLWGVQGLPYGNYEARETQAGYGTSLNTQVYQFSITKQDDKTAVIEINQDLPNQALNWNVMWTKVLESNSSLTGLNGAKFKVLPQDDNTKTAFENYGFYNNGDEATSGASEGANGFTQSGLTTFYHIPLGTQTDEAGVIARYQFQETETPKGTKTIVPINADVTLNKDKHGAPESYTFKIYWSDSKQLIYEETFSSATLKDDKTLTIHPDLGLVADEFIKQPSITTTALDGHNLTDTLGVGLTFIHDSARVANLEPSEDYTMTGQAVYQADGQPVLGKDGKALSMSLKFTTDPRGSAVVELNTPEFDTSLLQGKKITMLETVTDKNNQEVVKEDNWKNNPTQTVTVGKVTPSIDIEKANGKVPDAGNGNHTDKDNNVGVNDHDTEATYFEVKPEAKTKIFFRGTNTGTEPLTHIKVVDKTIKGSVNIENMSFTFNNKKLTVNKAGKFELDGKLLVLQPKETIIGSGMLGSLPNGELHGDKVTIDGIGVYSKKHVSDDDKWYGKVETPLQKIASVYLPKTGDTKSILSALGAWLITLALVGGVIVSERKRHTLTNAYQSIIEKNS